MSDDGRPGAGLPGAPREPEHAVRWLTGDAAEVLLDGGRVRVADGDAAVAAGRLALLLAAAGRPIALDPAREEAALAAFRSARQARSAVRPARRLRLRQSARMTVAVAASVVALSGVAVAVAATTGQVVRPTEPVGSSSPTAARSGWPDSGVSGAAGRPTGASPDTVPAPAPAAAPPGPPPPPPGGPGCAPSSCRPAGEGARKGREHRERGAGRGHRAGRGGGSRSDAAGANSRFRRGG